MKLEIKELIIGLFIYLIAIYVHEFGHYIVAKYYDKFISIDYNIVPAINYYTENKEEEIQILSYGIIFGFIIVFVYAIYLKNNYGNKGILLSIVFLISYLNGCLEDINRLITMI